MKILQVVRQYLPSTGGMETYVSSLCRELAARGHRSDVATLDYLFTTGEPLPAYEQIGGTDVIRLPSMGTARYFLAPRLLELLPRYDLVHVHGVDFFIDLLGGLKKAHGKPVVLSTHGGFFHTAWFPSLKNAYFHTVTRLALRGVDRVIASSPKDEELFRKICNQISLVENGIDYEKFASIRKKISGETMVFVGRISKNKRVDRLLEVLARVRETRPGTRLAVIGPDWEGLLDGLRQRANSLGLDTAVDFTGVLPREEMLARLAGARLFVSASEYEAFGLSTVEAMATGTVPVVNRIQAFADIIEDGGTGFLTDFAETEKAAAALVAALELTNKKLGEIGKKARKSAARYDWRHVADAVIGIYEEVLPGGNNHRGGGNA